MFIVFLSKIKKGIGFAALSAAFDDQRFMIWSVFRVLHRKSRENFAHEIYCVSLDEIDMEELQMEYQTVLKEAE